MKRKQSRPVAPVALDPNAPVFEIGDRIEVIKPNLLWQGYRGELIGLDGGMCRVSLKKTLASVATGFTAVGHFHADIPAAELKKL